MVTCKNCNEICQFRRDNGGPCVFGPEGPVKPKEVRLIPQSDELRQKAAIAALQGIMANSGFVNEHFEFTVDVVGYALYYADELIERLNKK